MHGMRLDDFSSCSTAAQLVGAEALILTDCHRRTAAAHPGK